MGASESMQARAAIHEERAADCRSVSFDAVRAGRTTDAALLQIAAAISDLVASAYIAEAEHMRFHEAEQYVDEEDLF